MVSRVDQLKLYKSNEMENEPQKNKSAIAIEAPSREQIAAAKKARRNLTMPTHEPLSRESKQQVRSYAEGVILLLMGAAVAWFLRDLQQTAWILAAILGVAGILLMIRSHGK